MCNGNGVHVLYTTQKWHACIHLENLRYIYAVCAPWYCGHFALLYTYMLVPQLERWQSFLQPGHWNALKIKQTWIGVLYQGHLGAVCLQHMALPAGCSISGKPALGQGHHHAVSSNTAHGATLIVSAGMGHCTAEVDQCTLQTCDEEYCGMVWSVQSQ